MGMNDPDDLKRQLVQLISDNNSLSRQNKDQAKACRKLQRKNEMLLEKLRIVRDKITFYMGVNEGRKRVYPDWVVQILSEDFGS